MKLATEESFVKMTPVDLMFTIKSGNVGKLAEEALKDNPAIKFWGPEAILLSMLLSRLTNEVIGEALDAVKNAFIVDGDTFSVNSQIIAGALAAIPFDMGLSIGYAARDEMAGVFRKVIIKSQERVRVQSGKAAKITLEEWEDYVARAYAVNVHSIMAYGLADAMTNEITRLEEIVRTDPTKRLVDKAALQARIARIPLMPAFYHEANCEVQSGYCWHHAALQEGIRNGVKTVQVVAMNDRRVCPVCELLDGMIYEINEAINRYQEALADPAVDPTAQTVGVIPFPRYADLDNMSVADREAQFRLPVYHPHCR
jgi:hypothetical protein